MKHKWNVEIRKKDNLYYAYSVHTNGAISLEGKYDYLYDAVLFADDLNNMLNKYYTNTKKSKEDDKLIGEKVSQTEVDDMLIFAKKSREKEREKIDKRYPGFRDKLQKDYNKSFLLEIKKQRN